MPISGKTVRHENRPWIQQNDDSSTFVYDRELEHLHAASKRAQLFYVSRTQEVINLCTVRDKRTARENSDFRVLWSESFCMGRSRCPWFAKGTEPEPLVGLVRYLYSLFPFLAPAPASVPSHLCLHPCLYLYQYLYLHLYLYICICICIEI